MTWLAKGGGVDNNVYLNIKGLSDEFEFHLAVGYDIQYNEFEHLPGLKIHICKTMGRAINLKGDLMALIYFIKLIKREHYDIVHTHEAKASIISRIAAFICGVKCIYGLHGVTFNDPLSAIRRNFYILLERLTIWMNCYITSTGQESVDHYHDKNIGNNIRFRVIHSGIDLEDFYSSAITSPEDKVELRSGLGIGTEDIVISNIGRFSYSKAQRYTIEAFSIINNQYPKTKLLLIGEGELKEECINLVQKFNLDNSVIFYGFSSEISRVLSITDIFAFTSLREGLPRAVVEASLMKIPTVAFDVEGVKEVLDNDKSGYIVPQFDIDQFVERLKILISDLDKRKLFGELAFDSVAGKWDSVKMINSHREVYNMILNQN